MSCGGSGTHLVASFLAATRKLGKVAHEDPSPTSKVLVSWAARAAPLYWHSRTGTAVGRPCSNWRPPMVAGPASRKGAPVIGRAHVAAPLKVLSSVAFGQCVMLVTCG